VADDFTQANRRLRIETPLGPDALLITALSGTEGLSNLFHFQAELLGRDEKADFDAIVGKGVTISVAAGGGDRFFHGVVSRFSQSGTVGRHATYRAEIVPWLWFLTRTSDCRIFQHKSVPDIVKQIFGEYGFTDYRFQVSGASEPREYCVQYRETDFNFVARLFEEEGIFFFFEHKEGKHTLVVANTSHAHTPCPVLDQLRFTHEQVSLGEDDVVTWFSKEQEVRASQCSLTDYNFETPSVDLMGSATGTDSRKYELYDYPACGTNRGRTESLARLRQEEEDTTRVLFRGASYGRSLTSGYKFSMRATGEDVSSTFDGSYVLTSVRHRASESYASGETTEVSYENDFECIAASVQFRPVRRTPQPVVHGVQTAVVVGPGGEEIFVDKYSRVKVQFFWDREGKRNENSSCWLRVSSSWAGKNWGMVSIPRIGQEVVVSFLEGDPDQPIIVGSVYNGEQMPPYDLPGNKTQSGLKSRSSLSGSPANFNEIRFEDKKGSEELYFHAEKDQTIVVENDRSELVGRDRSLRVERDKHEAIGRNKTVEVAANHSEKIGGSMSITVASTLTESVLVNYAESVGGAMELTVGAALAITVGAAMAETIAGIKTENIGGSKSENIGSSKSMRLVKNLSESVGENHDLKVGKDLTEQIGGKHEESVTKEYILNAKKIQLVAEDEMSFKTGEAEITMKKNGDVTIKGNKINVKGDGDIVIKGSKIKAN